jgi:chitinase
LEKIILGMNFNGQSFSLVDPDDNGIGAPITGPGEPGPLTGVPGMLGYNEVSCSLLTHYGLRTSKLNIFDFK